jgi:hypothetical protein
MKTTIPEPKKHKDVPQNAQWLSGEGAGSWFFIEKIDNSFGITRYNEAGEIECQADFKESGHPVFDMALPFQFVHLSHCQKVTIIQEGEEICFLRVEENDIDNSEVGKKRCYA